MIIQEYIFFWQAWVIAGMIFVMLEFFDGSTLIFLPLGLGGLLMALFLFLIESGVLLAQDWLPDQWYVLLMDWAVLSFVMAIVLVSCRRMWRGESKKDINRY